jgi:protein-L-isoaspartate(D-aspartate) O-methyltransferase
VTETDRFVKQRRAMVTEQIIGAGIRDPRVIDAMLTIPREHFVTQELQELAYGDHPLSIGEGQTISQPYTVAFMVEALELRPSDRILEIGAGSGYAAAVMSLIAREVHTIERIEAIALRAKTRLKALGFDNVYVHVGDGSQGLVQYSPFDAIAVTAGGNELPQPLVQQLADGGRLVIPIGTERDCQTMYRVVRLGDKLHREKLGNFRFVPLVGRHGWSDPAT